MKTKQIADVTVIIPVYNGKNYLKKAVDSVINQTILPKSIIVIDDGSTDGSLEVLRDLKSPIPLITITQPNAGQSAARNKGVSMSRTGFIAFLDQDDYWFSRHIEILIKPLIDNTKVGWVYSNFHQIEANGKTLSQNTLNYINITHPKTKLTTCLSEDMFILPSASIIRKKAFKDVGGFDERLSGYEDDDLFLRLFSTGWQNVFINKSLSAWRIYSTSTMFSENMMRSRRIYGEKLMQKYLTNPDGNVSYIKHCIAPRFYKMVADEYWRGLRIKNSKLRTESHRDMKHYAKFFNYGIKMKSKLFLLKYPALAALLDRFINLRD